VRRDKFSQLTDLRDTEQFAQMLLLNLQTVYAKDEDNMGYIYPQSRQDLTIYDLCGRHWLQVNWGIESTTREYGFYTAISPEHYIAIYYHPQQFWPQGTDQKPEILDKVMQPFWDFMNNLQIIDSADAELASGIHGEPEVIEIAKRALTPLISKYLKKRYSFSLIKKVVSFGKSFQYLS
jgi:hypothetical protein